MSNFSLEGNELVDHGNGLYTLDGFLRYNFVYPAIARFPCRMAIIQLSSSSGGGLLVWSPFSPTKDVMRELSKLNKPVRFIIAPNSLHWLGAADFATACENEINDDNRAPLLFGAPGLPHKHEVVDFMKQRGRKWDFIISEDNLPRDWISTEDIEFQHIPGSPMIEEVVLFHKPSKTLLAAELAFNFQQHNPKFDVTWPMSWYLRCADGYRPCCVTRTFRFVVEDPSTAIGSIESIISKWDFEALVPAHGEIITKNAKDMLQEGTLDLLYEIRRRKEKRSTIPLLAIGGVAVVCASYFLMRRKSR